MVLGMDFLSLEKSQPNVKSISKDESQLSIHDQIILHIQPLDDKIIADVKSSCGTLVGSYSPNMLRAVLSARSMRTRDHENPTGF